ncbi:MAG: terminase large subunit [Eubacteriales bacterium]|nr:terminase large subunit [Eubacteriales bacterium]
MTRLETIAQYARNCISGEISSGQKHKWACMRLLSDIERAKGSDCPFEWSERDAQNIVDWFSLLYHSKGVLAGTPIKLTEWQQFRLCQLYGWRMKGTGYRRFTKSFTEVSRKNGKSQEMSGVALYNMSVEATKYKELYEVYTAGVKRDQSKIVFNEAKLMLKLSPLRTKFNVKRDSITHNASGSFMKPLSKEDGQKGDGTNPATLIIDEYHQHPTTEFYDLGLGGNTKNPLLMIITTAGRDLSYPCYTQEYKYCSEILNPDIEVFNDSYLIDICEQDPEDYADISNLKNEKIWLKSNPIRATYKEGLDKIREELKIALSTPEKMIAVLTKMFDVWVQAKENGYMDMSKWRACEVDVIPIPEEALKGMDVYVGLDMSAKIDLTSVAFIIPYRSGKRDHQGNEITKYILYSHSFIPNRDKLMERITTDHVPYDAWEMMGFLSVTDTPIVDQARVMQYVIDFCEQKGLRIKYWCFDPANASKMEMDVSDLGYDVQEVYQSHRSLNESTSGFREQVYCKNVSYLENPLLTYAMGNAVIRTNNGLIKIDKDATRKRIDPVDATLCAFKLALYHDFDTLSKMESIDKFLEEDW